MPLQFYEIGTKISRDTTTHFWILIHLIENVIVKLFFDMWERVTSNFLHNSNNIKVIYIRPTFDVCLFLQCDSL